MYTMKWKTQPAYACLQAISLLFLVALTWYCIFIEVPCQFFEKANATLNTHTHNLGMGLALPLTPQPR